jgi:hypothetical protein
VHEPLQPLLAVAGGVLGDHGEKVDAVEAEPGDVERFGAGPGNPQTETHDSNPNAYYPKPVDFRLLFA